MKNLLPKFKSFSVDEESDALHTRWLPSSADPAEAKVPNYLLSLTELKSSHENPLDSYKRNILPPNQRHLTTITLNEPSPISTTERGEPERAVILMPNVSDYSKNTKPAPIVSPSILSFHFCNYMSQPMDIFIQKVASMRSSSMRAHGGRFSGTLLSNKTTSDILEKDLLSLYFTYSKKCIMTLCGRHEIKDISFHPGPIGLEVDCLYGRLICTAVAPTSQRVTTLEEFQSAVSSARLGNSIDLTIAIFSGEISKLHNMYALEAKTASNVKSLLSNMLTTGIDADFQHGIELPVKEALDSDDGDSISGSETSSHASPKSSVSLSGRSSKQLKSAKSSQSQSVVSAENSEGKEASDSDSSTSSFGRMNRGSRLRKSDATHSAPTRDVIESEDGELLGAKSTIKRREYHNEEDSPPQSPRLDDSPAGDKSEGVATLSKNEAEELVSAKSDETEPWDYATALETSELTLFPIIVSGPSHLRASKSWGKPDKIVQFSNLSTNWAVHVYWIDTDGALLFRRVLGKGEKHVEKISTEHVWVIKVDKITSDGYDDDEDGPQPEIPSSIMIMRPSESTLLPDKCTSLVWVPHRSVSVSQRMLAPPPKKISIRLQSSSIQPSVIANLHVQILDMCGNFTTGSSSQFM